MVEKFTVEFLADAVKFLNEIEPKAQEKIYYNIRKAQYYEDPILFKKTGKTRYIDLQKAERLMKNYFKI